MKIAIPLKDGRIDDHFGHCAYYEIIEIDQNNRIVSSEILDSPKGCGCKSNIAIVLKGMGVSVMLAGRMGEGALQKLNQNEIKVIRGCRGEVKSNVEAYLSGNLIDNEKLCEHHECTHKE